MTTLALIACRRGLYLYDDGQAQLLRPGDFYGLTRQDNWWYVYQRHGRQGHIHRFQLQGTTITDFRTIFRGTSHGVHQIDFVGNRLFVLDTYRNEVIVLSRRRWWGWRKESFYPRGRLPVELGRAADNYAHINSVFCANDRLYLLAHNETQKTSRPSQILVLEPDSLTELAVLDDVGGSAHNVLELGDQFLVCDSLAGTLRDHGRVVFQAETYLRGLAVNDEVVLVGGSQKAERGNRDTGTGFVYKLDRQFNLLEVHAIPGATQLYEIRLCGLDYGLSNTQSSNPIAPGQAHM